MAHASSIPGGFCCCLCGSIGWWLLAPCVPTLLSIMLGYQQGEISGSAIDTILIMPTMGSCKDAKWQESKLLLPIANDDIEWHWPLALLLTVPEVCYLYKKSSFNHPVGGSSIILIQQEMADFFDLPFGFELGHFEKVRLELVKTSGRVVILWERCFIQPFCSYFFHFHVGIFFQKRWFTTIW